MNLTGLVNRLVQTNRPLASQLLRVNCITASYVSRGERPRNPAPNDIFDFSHQSLTLPPDG